MSHRVYIVITVCWTIKNKIHPLNTLEESLKSARDKHRHGVSGFPHRSDGDEDTPDSDIQGHSERVGWFKLCWNRNLINFRKKRAARRRRHSMYKMTKLGRLSPGVFKEYGRHTRIWNSDFDFFEKIFSKYFLTWRSRTPTIFYFSDLKKSKSEITKIIFLTSIFWSQKNNKKYEFDFAKSEK